MVNHTVFKFYPNKAVNTKINDLNRCFSKVEKTFNIHQLNLILVNENQNHNETRFILSRMAVILNMENNEHWKGCGETGTHIYCWWELKLL